MLKPKLLALVGVLAFVVILVTALNTLMDPTTGKLGFYTWRLLSGKGHGGQYIDVDKVRIYFETYGSGPPVLILHGGLGCLEDMQHQIRALAGTRFVIAPDSRGHGRSTDSDDPLSYADMADDMIKLIDHLKLDKVDVVGWSDGGIIGLDLAIHHPERIRRLVAIGSNYDVDGLRDKPPSGAEPPPPRGVCVRNLPHWPVFYRKVITMWQTQPNYTLDDLSRIKAPSLIMAGEFDVIKRSHTDRLAKAIPGGREEIIIGATHFAGNDKPGIVNADILRFLDEPLP